MSKPINGVAIRHAASGLTATISIQSAGASARRRLVIRTSLGPFSRLRAAARASLMVDTLRPVRCSSSKWLGVTRSAAGMARSRKNVSMPGLT